MNIIIDSTNLLFAENIARQVAGALRCKMIVYNYTMNQYATGGDKWVAVGMPVTTREYKRFCQHGYTPELVICIDAAEISYRRERLETLYEGMFASVDRARADIIP